MKASELWDEIAKNHADFLTGLYSRWLEEQDYEDIKDYLNAIQKRLPTAFKIKKRPFAVSFRTEDGMLEVKASCEGRYLALSGKIIPIQD